MYNCLSSVMLSVYPNSEYPNGGIETDEKGCMQIWLSEEGRGERESDDLQVTARCRRFFSVTSLYNQTEVENGARYA
jgi:hypothetical protein